MQFKADRVTFDGLADHLTELQKNFWKVAHVTCNGPDQFVVISFQSTQYAKKAAKKAKGKK